MTIEGTESPGLSENVPEVEMSGLNEINNPLPTGKELLQRNCHRLPGGMKLSRCFEFYGPINGLPQETGVSLIYTAIRRNTRGRRNFLRYSREDGIFHQSDVLDDTCYGPTFRRCLEIKLCLAQASDGCQQVISRFVEVLN
jgi:hypothetical protein